LFSLSLGRGGERYSSRATAARCDSIRGKSYSAIGCARFSDGFTRIH
jgi:hypothetical protein